MRLNKFKMLFLTSVIIAGYSCVSYAGDWQNTENGWQYVEDDGVSLRSEAWQFSDGLWYYLGPDGKLVKDAMVLSNGEYYYLNESGAMVTNEWHYLREDEAADFAWYYFGSSGKAYRSHRSDGNIMNIDGKRYMFDDSGKMLTGFISEDGVPVDVYGGHGFELATYLTNENGELYTNEWVNLKEVGTDDKFSILAQRDYDSYLEMWMYFGDNSKKYKANSVEQSVKKEINGQKYSFDENGIMIPGLYAKRVDIAADKSKNTILYSGLDTNGALVGEYWTYTVPNQGMDEEEYDAQAYSWFRTKADGSVYKNKIYEVNGKDYVFDSLGRMQCGFVLIGDNGHFLIQHDVDDYASADFLKSKDEIDIPAMDRGNLYFFSNDEFNDGSKQFGKDIDIALDDDIFTFGFKNSGIAYGSRCRLEFANNAYYYNGLKLKADLDYGYGLIDVKKGSEVEYVVVNSNGFRIKGTKILKDNQGAFIVVQNGKFVARIDDYDKPRRKNGVFYRYDASLPSAQRYVEPISYAVHGGDNLEEGFILFEQ